MSNLGLLAKCSCICRERPGWQSDVRFALCAIVANDQRFAQRSVNPKDEEEKIHIRKHLR